MNDSVLMTPAWLRRFTKLVAAATLFLVFAGAMVTSTGSGLAVPDWPLSYGMIFPPMVGGIFYEHGHRLIASAVGLLTVIQALWLQRKETRRFIRILGWVSVGAVILQGLLGGLTVIFLLPPAISIAHAALAEIFFCLNVSLALFTSVLFSRLSAAPAATDSSPLARPAQILVLLLFAQVLLGAVMRHLGAGLAIPDFPLSFGRLIPEMTSVGVAVNFAHRTGAAVVTLFLLSLAGRVFGSARREERSIYATLVALLGIQITLGGWTVWTGKHPVVTSVHVMTGAAMLATALVFAIVVSARSRKTAERPAVLTEVIA